MRLCASLAPLFRRERRREPRERWLILAARARAARPSLSSARPWSTIAGIAVSLALLFTVLRGRALHLHGAEHRAIAAAEERRLARDVERARAKPSRFSPRCGTNFAALALPVTFVADQLLPLAPAFWSPLVVLVLSLALTMELWRIVQRSSHRVLAGVSAAGPGAAAADDARADARRDAGRAAGRGRGPARAS